MIAGNDRVGLLKVIFSIALVIVSLNVFGHDDGKRG